MNNKSFIWRIWMAIVLTSLGVFYYLVFLFYLCAGVPIEKIHYFMTDSWPSFYADNVALVAPVFLFVGLYFWYSYTKMSKPKPVPEAAYDFRFTTVEKSPELQREPDYVFESRAVRSARSKASAVANVDTDTAATAPVIATPSSLIEAMSAPIKASVEAEPEQPVAEVKPVEKEVLAAEPVTAKPIAVTEITAKPVTPIPITVKPIVVSAVTATRVTIPPAVAPNDNEA